MNIVQSLEKSSKTGCCKRPTTLVLSFSLKRSKFNEQIYIIRCCKKLVLASSSSCGKLQFLALPQWFHALRMYPTLHPLQQAWETCQRPTVFVDLYYCTIKSLLLSTHTFLQTRTERNNKIKVNIFRSLSFFFLSKNFAVTISCTTTVKLKLRGMIIAIRWKRKTWIDRSLAASSTTTLQTDISQCWRDTEKQSVYWCYLEISTLMQYGTWGCLDWWGTVKQRLSRPASQKPHPRSFMWTCGC